MALGTGLFLIAIGAILKYAVSDSVEGVDLSTIGVILMAVGIIGIILSFFMDSMWRRGTAAAPMAPADDVVVERERRAYR